MNPTDRLKLVSQLLDLPLIDRNGEYCGVVDDVEFSGGPGKEAKLAALLVGPGAYAGRMPGWAMAIVGILAGDRVTRVPIGKVKSIKSFVQLKATAKELGLHMSEERARAWIPRHGAL